jgi:enoyl-[acyl-carrier protein] reductase II
MRTALCDLLGIECPIIQAGMGPFTNANLVVAVSEAGGLGSLGASQRSPDQLREELARIRARTARPFAVNFLVSDFSEESFAVALAAGTPVVSFALGDPGDLVRRAQDAGAKVIHQVHTVAQAEQAAGRGVDVLIAQGGEAGGFGQDVAALPLIPQVADAVRPLPVVAARGIADGRGVAAALLLGAAGANLGTRFLASVEAPIAAEWKRAIVAGRSEEAVKAEFWNDIMPRPGQPGYGTVPRALRTPFQERWNERRPEARAQAEAIRAEMLPALQAGRFHEYVPFAGQTVGLIRDILPAGEIVRRLMAEATSALQQGAALATRGTGPG